MPIVLLIRHAQASFGSRRLRRALRPRSRAGAGAPSRARSARDRGRPSRQRLAAAPARHRAPLGSDAGVTMTVDERWNEYERRRRALASLDDADAAGTTPDRHRAGAELARFPGRARSGPPASGSTRALPARRRKTWPEFLADDQRGARRPRGRSAERPDRARLQLERRDRRPGGIADRRCRSEAFVPLNRVSVNASITKVDRRRRGKTLVSYNEHSHLEEAGGDLVTYR